MGQALKCEIDIGNRKIVNTALSLGGGMFFTIRKYGRIMNALLFLDKFSDFLKINLDIQYILFYYFVYFSVVYLPIKMH